MDARALYPSNIQTLTGDVVVRAKNYPISTNENRKIQQPNLHSEHTFSRLPQDFETMTKPTHLRARTTVMSKRMERQRWRANQSRYRKQHIECVTNLEESNRQLQQEIKQLEERQSCLSSGNGTRICTWSVAIEYFETFRHGLFSDTLALPYPQSLRAQQNFIQTNVTPNVVFHGGCGTEALLESWKCLSLALQNFEVGLEGLEKESSNSVVATTRTSFTLTERTVRHIFPHLLSADTKYKNATLLQQLVGKDIVVLGQTRFEWNGPEGKVISIMAQSDFLTPVLRLVGSLKNASRVFEKSRISPELVWKT